MFGLIRILLLLVIIAAVALLIRPDLIKMTGLADSKPPQSKEKAVSAPVAEQQVSESAKTTDTNSPKSVEQTVEQTAEKTTEKAAISEQSIAPEESNAPQESDKTAESEVTQALAPGHDAETLKQSDAEWGFDSSQEATQNADNATPETAVASPRESVTAAETGTPQENAPAHDPETLKQSDAEWGFDNSPGATPDTDTVAPEASGTPQESDSGTTDATQSEAELRQKVAELQALAADIIANPDQ